MFSVQGKKSLTAAERDPWERALFALQQASFDATDLVVLDEFGSKLDMLPTHAWAPIGQRAVAAVPPTTPITTSTIAAMPPQGSGPALVIAGGVDQATFAAYLEQVVAPTLRAGQIVLADTLSAHKSARAQEIIATCGCTLLYLPAYWPDYSPIELAIATIKSELRRAAARSREALEAAIAKALAQITAAEHAPFSCIVAIVFSRIWIDGFAFRYSTASDNGDEPLSPFQRYTCRRFQSSQENAV